MELNKKSINCFNKVFESSFCREESAESVVPDTMSDIFEIIDADGLVVLRGKEASEGRVSLTGSVNTVIMYWPDGERGARRLSLSIPFTVSSESPAINERCRPVADVRLVGIDARMLNPRKVLVRVEICVWIRCFEEGTMELITAPAPGNEAFVHVLQGTLQASPVVGVREKTFVLTDELNIPASKPEFGALLKEKADFFVEEVKAVGNKVVFKGLARLSLLYQPEAAEELATVEFTTDFSQILELDSEWEQADVEINLMLTGAYFEPLPASQDGRAISVELHLVAQAVCSMDMELEYISDAYSNEFDMELSFSTVEAASIDRRMSVRENVREMIEISSQITELVHAYAILGSVSIDGKKITCPVCLRVSFCDEAGVLRSVEKKTVVESTIEIDVGMEISVSQIICADMLTSFAAAGIEVRLPIDFELQISTRKNVTAISAIEMNMEAPQRNSQKPSITVVSAVRGVSIWSLAKKHCSTPEIIRLANGIEDEIVEDGVMLLIPRQR